MKVSEFTLIKIFKKLDELSEKYVHASFWKIQRQLETKRRTNIHKKMKIQT